MDRNHLAQYVLFPQSFIKNKSCGPNYFLQILFSHQGFIL